MHAGPACRNGQHSEQEGQEAAANPDLGQAKAEPADHNPAHTSTQVWLPFEAPLLLASGLFHTSRPLQLTTHLACWCTAPLTTPS